MKQKHELIQFIDLISKNQSSIIQARTIQISKSTRTANNSVQFTSRGIYQPSHFQIQSANIFSFQKQCTAIQ